MRPIPIPSLPSPEPPTPAARLAGIAALVDEGCAHEAGHVLVHLAEAEPDEVAVGLRPLPAGRHPFEEVAGFAAPESWWAFGVRVRGRAHHLDQPGARPVRTAVTFLTDRAGHEVSLQRTGSRTRELPARAAGTIPDLCRRAIGLPTDPPPRSTAPLWTTIWLDRLLDAWGQPSRRRALTSSWATLAALHPAVPGDDAGSCPTPEALLALAGRHTADRSWASVRAQPAALALPDGPLPPEVARWMDDGFFARWVLGAYPSPARLVDELAPLLGAPLGRHLRRTTEALLALA